MECWVYKW